MIKKVYKTKIAFNQDILTEDIARKHAIEFVRKRACKTVSDQTYDGYDDFIIKDIVLDKAVPFWTFFIDVYYFTVDCKIIDTKIL